ncbi:hypothetical protein PBY51_017596 [Eleginops maclovinus]|uniref:Uncharacterized protein n=1 Tax=Eleginops maclovinus TaxID=56733 RepID=A0AAN7XFA1_ELEMC|nr:hypothetical protein PBY51_017596 [Eleginops maclovinus]
MNLKKWTLRLWRSSCNRSPVLPPHPGQGKNKHKLQRPTRLNQVAASFHEHCCWSRFHMAHKCEIGCRAGAGKLLESPAGGL